jgi:hypothetical protein
MHRGSLFPWLAIAAAITSERPAPVSLACATVSSQLDAILAQGPPNSIAGLRSALLTCYGAHRICGVVYDQSQPYAHVFSGEQSSDVPEVQLYDGGASYALMASRSLPPSRKSGLLYCLALTPDEQRPGAPFDWHGWQVSPAGKVRELDLSQEPVAAVHTNPRSMAVALWNLYTRRF